MIPRLFFDIDGTYQQESLVVSLFKALVREGFFPREVDEGRVEYESMWANHQIDYGVYINEVVRLFTQNIQFLYEKDVLTVSKQVVNDSTLRVYKHVAELVKQAKHTHWRIALSKSPDFLVRLWAKKIGIDLALGTKCPINEKGMFTGGAMGYDKGDLVQQLMPGCLGSVEKTMAIGDSGDDILMLSKVSIPIAFNPDQELLEVAKRRGWPVWVERKSGLYAIANCEGRDSPVSLL